MQAHPVYPLLVLLQGLVEVKMVLFVDVYVPSGYLSPHLPIVVVEQLWV